MSDDTCQPAAAPLDASHLIRHQMQPCPSCGALTPSHRVLRFGQPSNYSLSHLELGRHVRKLRRAGWQSWEIRARFDFWRAA
jgi:hypothetical protein